MYSTLKNSYQWNQFNQSDAVNNRIAEILTNGEMITLDRIPSAVLTMKNRLRSPILSKLLDAIREERLMMVYAEKYRVPQYLPFVLSMQGPNTCNGIVFLKNLDIVGPTDGEITLNARKLQVALESCYCAMKFTELGNSAKLHSNAILRSGSKIYSSIISECINRKHSTKLDPTVFNSILYLSSEYYIGTMLGCFSTMNEETMRNYCLYNCRTTDYVSLERVTSQFTREDFTNIATFISKLSQIEELQKRLGKLTVSNFLESCINMYDASMLLGLETFCYFFWNVVSVNESTYVNNYQVLKNIVGDDGRKLYADIISTVMNM